MLNAAVLGVYLYFLEGAVFFLFSTEAVISPFFDHFLPPSTCAANVGSLVFGATACCGCSSNQLMRCLFCILQVLETLIKNCGDNVHQQVAEKNVLQELVKIVKKKVGICLKLTCPALGVELDLDAPQLKHVIYVVIVCGGVH